MSIVLTFILCLGCLILGAWAMRSDIMKHHKPYFDKIREREMWKNKKGGEL